MPVSGPVFPTPPEQVVVAVFGGLGRAAVSHPAVAMPAPRQKEPEMMATAEPSPAPRLKCSNEQCEYLASLDTEKILSCSVE